MADVERRLDAAQAAAPATLRRRARAARAVHRLEPPLPGRVRAGARARPQGHEPRRREPGRAHLHPLRLGQVRPRLPREDGLGAHARPALRRHAHQVPAAVGRASTATSSPCTASTSPATTSASCAPRTSPWRTAPRATPSSAAASRRWPTSCTRACASASAPTARRRATSWTCSTRCAPCCSCTAPSSATSACSTRRSACASPRWAAPRRWAWRPTSAASSPASAPTSSPSTSRARTSRRSPIRTRRSSTAPTRTTSGSPSSAGASSTATAPTWAWTRTPIRSRAVAVREKLQDRVRTGAVEVGGADSGWWHDPRSSRGDRLSAARSPQGQVLAEDRVRGHGLPHGRVPRRRVLRGAQRLHVVQQRPGSDVDQTLDQEIAKYQAAVKTDPQDADGVANLGQQLRVPRQPGAAGIRRAEGRLGAGGGGLRQGRQAPRQAEGHGRQGAAPGRARASWSTSSCSSRTTRRRPASTARSPSSRPRTRRPSSTWRPSPSTPATPTRRCWRSPGSSSSIRSRRTRRRSRTGSSRTPRVHANALSIADQVRGPVNERHVQRLQRASRRRARRGRPQSARSTSSPRRSSRSACSSCSTPA